MNFASLILSAVVAVSATNGDAQATQPSHVDAKSADAYVAAFDAHDAKALAEQWAPNAVYHNEVTNEKFVGREAIEKHFATLFAAHPDVKLQVTQGSFELLAPSVAVERGSATLVGSKLDGQPVDFTAVYVQTDGKWLCDRLTDHRPKPPVLSNYEHLKPLEWMVGNWTDETDGVRVSTDCKWSKNRNFLTRSFAIGEFSGMQVIGYDAASKQIRSWTFDSDGGFSEATWSKKGDHWYVHNHGVLGDGRKASATQIIKPVDDRSFTWQIVDRTAGGEMLPNVEEFLVVRQ